MILAFFLKTPGIVLHSYMQCSTNKKVAISYLKMQTASRINLKCGKINLSRNTRLYK